MVNFRFWILDFGFGGRESSCMDIAATAKADGPRAASHIKSACLPRSIKPGGDSRRDGGIFGAAWLARRLPLQPEPELAVNVTCDRLCRAKFLFSAGRKAWLALVLAGQSVCAFLGSIRGAQARCLVSMMMASRPRPAVLPGRINSALGGARSVRDDFLARLFLSGQLRRWK